MNLSVHIERLVIDGAGLGGGQPQLLQAAIEAELARLLGAGALAPALCGGAALPRIALAEIGAAAAGDTPAALGARIAGAVYGGIGA